MVEYTKVNIKLSDTQLKKLKAAVKKKSGTTLRFKNAWWKWSASWIIFDSKTKKKKKKKKKRNPFNKKM